MRALFAKPFTFVFGALVLAALFSARSTGAADATSRDGCVNQWLFNGVWRVQVTKVEPAMNGTQQIGWQVTEVWRNGTSQEISPGDSLLKDQTLELSNGGTILASATTTGSMSSSEIAAHDFPASGQFTHVQRFAASGVDPTNKPKAVDILFDAAKLAQYKSKPQFTTHQYNFHFKLDCTASAATQAQGGSSQIAAKEGCMNQWMSNGVWRVRATALGPDNGNGGPQIGWMITEDWVSLVHRAIAPGNTNVTDQQLVFAGGNTVASSNSAGTTMNMADLLARTFPPGGSFTYQQRFRPTGPFAASDKPVKLILTFNATAEKKNANAPQYKNPANFRISLTCTK